MTTIDNARTMALIERVERETPFCECGEPMAPVARNHQIWLTCSSQQHRAQGTLRRLLAALASAGHTRRFVIDPA